MSKRVNIALKEDTHTKAKILSVINGISLNDYFENAIKKAVEKDANLLNKINEL